MTSNTKTEAGAPFDGDSEETRKAFREYDAEYPVTHRSHWQIWRDAIAYAHKTGLTATTPQADAAPSVDAIATELWKAADACGFEQFRETVRAAIAAGGAQEPIGHADVCPGSDGGFTMAVFKASDVPEGSPIYAAPLPREAATVWQPIETAPKDGTVIDLYVGGEFEGRRASCYWGKPEHDCGEHGRYCDSDWHDLDDGWVDDLNEPLASWEQPTHWMPLPAAPAAASNGEQEVGS
jgi:hypothetical protein